MEILKNISVAGSDQRPMATDIFYVDEGNPKPVVIYVHGFNGFKDWGGWDLMARQFADAGFVLIKFNTSHNGTTLENPGELEDTEAFGNNNYSKEIFDLQRVIDWTLDPANPHSRMIDGSRLFLIGHSRGGGVAIISTAEDSRVKGLATWASVSEATTPWGGWSSERISVWKSAGVEYYLNARTQQKQPLYYQLYEDFEQNRERLDIRVAIGRIRVPVLICHGRQDPAVSVEQALALKQHQPEARLFLVDADHVFGRKHPWTENRMPAPMQAVLNETIEFFRGI